MCVFKKLAVKISFGFLLSCLHNLTECLLTEKLLNFWLFEENLFQKMYVIYLNPTFSFNSKIFLFQQKILKFFYYKK